MAIIIHSNLRDLLAISTIFWNRDNFMNKLMSLLKNKWAVRAAATVALLIVAAGVFAVVAAFTKPAAAQVEPTQTPSAAVSQATTSIETTPAVAQTLEGTATLTEEPAPDINGVDPDAVIAKMNAHYGEQGVDLGCVPYRREDVEVAQVLSVSSFEKMKVKILSRDNTPQMTVILMGVSNHADQGKDGEAKRLMQGIAQGATVLLIRGNVDARKDAYLRYVVTTDGLLLNYEAMTYGMPYVSSVETNECYVEFITRSNQD